ncbi:MAG: SAM-dependent methyltransferase [gamma proteobacterium symbiont of Bathyaustriella thionipta]|nr:SAM-dependent methyltransferase [gamma proteobacterium symbiont of Bathyaustriella thionipta]MCU7948775.1 SAM-dependent methyltransferase [gamma proteobacterium symbiont of Bathyaustriella thionipta]MCU7954988.1 SAM-dependent methyltransferase [gamma proteobacterium symbiont of Bathyaustriella thionipta]MCU7955316.1 SAM-dependent methyltransferase [gamma proteobacterium symbiont of Bathyaustriella thionipta]MCU7967067.1 SAM-dependent methyltransferase [gamma proteobacterium symbiont of Bathy
MSQRIPLFSISLLSATALGYEVLLMRLFSIIQWHHFAYMIISLALLGYGISGTLIALFQKQLLKHFNVVYPGLLVLFSLATLICYLTVQQIPFNAEAIFWDTDQLIYLLSIFLLLSIPFIFAASAICLALARYPEDIARLYGMDLLGAGAGSIAVILLLLLVFPMTALMITGLLGLCSAFIAVWELNLRLKRGLISIIVIACGFILFIGLNSVVNISPYKELSQILRINGTQIISQHSSPLGLLSVIESPVVPLRHVPCLSLNNTQEPLAQLGLFTDASGMTAITRYPEHLTELAYLDQLTSALPYHLNKIQRLLIVGAGGGSDVLQAQYHQVENIDAVEINAQVVDLLEKEFAKYSGALYQQANVNVHIDDVRGFLSTIDADQKKPFDLIQLSLMDSFTASASGLYALHESYLYTQEAIQTYIKHLSTDGYLAISRWVKTPPRDTLKMFATAVKSLERLDKKDPGQHLLLIRSWQISTLLIKKSAFTKQEIEAVKSFCQRRSFDIAWYPGISKHEVNKFNIFSQAYFYQGAKALLGDNPDQYLQKYKYYLYPATDDQPFFHHFFKWSVLPELLNLRGQGGVLLMGMGYLILIATLLLAITASIILILLPLLGDRRSQLISASNNNSPNCSQLNRGRLLLYFFMIGLAFLFIEIAFMQKFILFLHHPIYSITIVLAAFLINAGIGSIWSRHLEKKYSGQQVIKWAISGIIVLSVLYSVILNPLFSWLIALPILFKIILSLILIAPLAICMGMPFPLALSSLADNADGQVQAYLPWAWGVNGSASVISAVLASILAVHFGFTIVVLIAISLYYFCLLLFPGFRVRQ